ERGRQTTRPARSSGCARSPPSSTAVTRRRRLAARTTRGDADAHLARRHRQPQAHARVDQPVRAHTGTATENPRRAGHPPAVPRDGEIDFSRVRRSAVTYSYRLRAVRADRAAGVRPPCERTCTRAPFAATALIEWGREDSNLRS